MKILCLCEILCLHFHLACCCYVGESPSSSVSDVDNLNSYGLSKASSSKVGNSHYVPGNHWPLAVHNQAHLLRLLAYVSTFLNVPTDCYCEQIDFTISLVEPFVPEREAFSNWDFNLLLPPCL